MRRRKNTRKDCRGEVLSMKMIPGCLQKMEVLTKINRPIRILIDKKPIATNQEKG